MYPYRYRTVDTSNELSHHGIKGQKWGVRRFQNGDGSVTPAGAQRYYGQYNKNYHTSDDPKNVPNHSSEKSSSNQNGNKTPDVKYGVAVELVAAAAAIGVVAAADLAVKGHRAIKNKNLNKEYVNRLNKQREGEDIDEKTGLHKMTSPGTRESNMKAVNPDFTGYEGKNVSAGTVQNCLLCTTAYEMRCRGYDASAKKSIQPRNGMDFTNKCFKGAVNNDVPGSAKLDSFESLMLASAKCAEPGGNRELAKNTLSHMSKQPDSRGQLLVVWGYGGGHSMAYEVKGGKFSILDCQQNKVFEGKDAEDLISKTCAVQYQRLDNLEINEKGIRRYCA